MTWGLVIAYIVNIISPLDFSPILLDTDTDSDTDTKGKGIADPDAMEISSDKGSDTKGKGTADPDAMEISSDKGSNTKFGDFSKTDILGFVSEGVLVTPVQRDKILAYLKTGHGDSLSKEYTMKWVNELHIQRDFSKEDLQKSGWYRKPRADMSPEVLTRTEMYLRYEAMHTAFLDRTNDIIKAKGKIDPISVLNPAPLRAWTGSDVSSAKGEFLLDNNKNLGKRVRSDSTESTNERPNQK